MKDTTLDDQINKEIKIKARTQHQSCRSVEDLNERFQSFCEKHDLDDSMDPEDMLGLVDFQSKEYLCIERYIKNVAKATALGFHTNEDSPSLPSLTQTLKAADASIAQRELEAQSKTPAQPRKLIFGTVINTVSMEAEKVVRKTIPSLFAKKTRSGKIQMALPL
jgi:hypothetical protein